MERERDRVDRGGDEVGAGARGLERRRERVPPAPWQYRPTGRPLASRARDELVRAVRLERAGRVVEQHARGAELGQLLRLLDERAASRRGPGL